MVDQNRPNRELEADLLEQILEEVANSIDPEYAREIDQNMFEEIVLRTIEIYQKYEWATENDDEESTGSSYAEVYEWHTEDDVYYDYDYDYEWPTENGDETY